MDQNSKPDAGKPTYSDLERQIAALKGDIEFKEQLTAALRKGDGERASKLEDERDALATKCSDLQAALLGQRMWTYDMTPPQGFIEYVQANYDGAVEFHDPAWHAARLWNAAMRNAKDAISVHRPPATSAGDQGFPCFGVFRKQPDLNDGQEFFHCALWHNETRWGEGHRVVEGRFVPDAPAAKGAVDQPCTKCGDRLPPGKYCKGIGCPLNPAVQKGGA